MKRQTPKYNSLRDYIKSEETDKEAFDIKEQFDEALWGEYLERLYNSDKVTYGRDKAFYKNRMDSLRSISGDFALINVLKYKGLPKFCDFDCDGTIKKDYLKQGYYSWFPREIYRTLWNWRDLCRINKNDFKFSTIRQFANSCYDDHMQMGPDTMNSFWITFSAYLVENYSDTYRWNNFKNTVFFKEGENGKQRNRADRIQALIEEDGNYICSEKIKEFAKWTHTVGNLVLVPAGYNGYRGTQPYMKDYFDLSLDNLVHRWDGNHFLGEDEKTVKQSFMRYINTFFLWDYVDENYQPVPMCESHRKQMEIQYETKKPEARGVLPGKEEIDDLCGCINDGIRRRGLFVIAMLRIAMGVDLGGKDAETIYTYSGKYCDKWADWKVTGIYKKIMEEVFLEENLYTGGYNEVINVIGNRIAGGPDEGFVSGILDGLKMQTK